MVICTLENNYIPIVMNVGKINCFLDEIIFREEQLNGDYPCAGSIIIYTHPETDQEDLVIKGPISEDIQLQVLFKFLSYIF